MGIFHKCRFYWLFCNVIWYRDIRDPEVVKNILGCWLVYLVEFIFGQPLLKIVSSSLFLGNRA